MTVLVGRLRRLPNVDALYRGAQLTAMVSAFAFLVLIILGTFH